MNYKLYIVSLLLLGLFTCCSDSQQTVKRTTVAMGTIVEVQVRGVSENKAEEAINAAFKEFKRVDTVFSTYMKDNYMWKINNSTDTSIQVTPEMFYMLKKSEEYYKLTEGAFDPAVGNLIKLIGFENNEGHLPSPDSIKEALKSVGWKNIELTGSSNLHRKNHVVLNFGAIAKGYGVDRAAKVLEDHGIKVFLVNAGGEIKAVGNDWQIGIQHPRKKDALLGKLVINGMGIATSGDYEQYFKNKGKRYNHIINPATGIPSTGTEAVTVITDSVIDADALATGISVLGAAEGLKLVEKLPNTEALIVDTTGKIFESSGFNKFFKR